eukprot:GHVT01019418.1.p1 GENE.GHVT01019418.1~~GHVT01019418.1.p1  ORF type:complete len:228 (+),score=14.26 GHVT01019418.1:213-896(+)
MGLNRALGVGLKSAPTPVSLTSKHGSALFASSRKRKTRVGTIIAPLVFVPISTALFLGTCLIANRCMASAKQNSSDIRSFSTPQNAPIRSSPELGLVVPIIIEGPVCLLPKASQNKPPHNAGPNQLPHNAIIPFHSPDAPINDRFLSEPNRLSLKVALAFMALVFICGLTALGSSIAACATPGTKAVSLPIMAATIVGWVSFGAGMGSILVTRHRLREKFFSRIDNK